MRLPPNERAKGVDIIRDTNEYSGINIEKVIALDIIDTLRNPPFIIIKNINHLMEIKLLKLSHFYGKKLKKQYFKLQRNKLKKNILTKMKNKSLKHINHIIVIFFFNLFPHTIPFVYSNKCYIYTIKNKL